MQFWRLLSHRLGWGSFENGCSGRNRVMVGRTTSDTRPSSLIWGVTPITRPTATVLAVVLKVVKEGPVEGVVVCACISKYTMLSTTFSSAVWLLSAISFGLDSTRVLPNSCSSFTVPLMLPILVVGLT